MLLNRPFSDAQLEAHFWHQQLHKSAADLLRLLSLLIPVHIVLALCRVPSGHPALLLFAGSATLTLVLCLLLSPLVSARLHHFCVPSCALWLCADVLLLLFFLPSPSALLPPLICIFALYTFFPFRPFWLILASIGLSIAQLANFAAGSEDGVGTEQLVAALLAHLWTHLIGLYGLFISRKIARAVFLNARNAVETESELEAEGLRMDKLLSASLPPQVIVSVQSQLRGPDVPRVFVQHFGHCSVLLARLHGLPAVLSQLPVPDSSRLLNELDVRIARLVKLHGLLLVQSDAVLVLSGVPKSRDDHALAVCRFAFDLLTLVKSFCDATFVDVQVRMGIGSGALSGGIVGARRWHWDVIGIAMDAAIHLESHCPPGSVLISEDTWRHLAGRLPTERVDHGAWLLLNSTAPPAISPSVQSFCFPQAPHRFSLLTIPQAVNRLLTQLQSLHQPIRPSVANKGTLPMKTTSTNSKRKCQSKSGGTEQCQHSAQPTPLLGLPPMMPFSLRFMDSQLERLFHAQIDRWFIPGLALSVLFLALFGLFQALVRPRLLTTLATLALALGLMFLLLLALYVSCCESFCQFVTRTSLGHSIAVLLVLTLLSFCGIANTFSCPPTASSHHHSASSSSPSSICHTVHFPALSFALWMLHSVVFPRFPSALLLLLLLSAVALLSVHLLITHASLYALSSAFSLIRADLLLHLLFLALLLFFYSRRNEQLLRMDFLAILRSIEDSQRLHRVEFLNDQILHNALPAHIALNYAVRTEPFAHSCPSVGVLCARLGRPGDWVGEFGFDRLNRIVCDMDSRLAQLSEHRLEKVRSSHSDYTVACGILPELARNVHDAPFTIGEQLASLAEFAQEIEKMAESEGLDVAIGLDCGEALSAVIGWESPRYELLGQPNIRAKKLVEAARALGGDCVLLSEDVYSALRPRSQFHFDERSALSVAPGLIAYSLLRNPPSQPQQPLSSPFTSQKPPPPPHRQKSDRIMQQSVEEQQQHSHHPQSAVAVDLSPVGSSSSNALLLSQRAQGELRLRCNPLADVVGMFSSVHSSLSSELFSVDLLSVETDSELEWVTPAMIANREYRPYGDPSNTSSELPNSKKTVRRPSYKGERARQYSESFSDFSQMENPNKGGYYWGVQPIGKKRSEEAAARASAGKGKRSWRSTANSSMFSSALSLQKGEGKSALERLNSASRRVDKMLKELAGIEPGMPKEAVDPFPLLTNGGNEAENGRSKVGRGGGGGKRKEEEGNGGGGGGGAMLSEYDNDEEEADEEEEEKEERMIGGGRGGSWKGWSRMMMRRRVKGNRTANNDDDNLAKDDDDGGEEADISCSCSSMASSQKPSLARHHPPYRQQQQNAKRAPFALSGGKWRQSVHSIGYDNEYEFASAPLSSCSSCATGTSCSFSDVPIELPPLPPSVASPPVGQNYAEFALIDADESPAKEAEEGERKNRTATEGASLRSQMLQLSRDIRTKFGDFPLAHFSDCADSDGRGNGTRGAREQ